MDSRKNLPQSSVLSAKLTHNAALVKRIVNKSTKLTHVFAVSALLCVGSTAFAAPADPLTNAMKNAIHLTNMIHSVMPQLIPRMVEKIANNKVRRVAPAQPVWILDSDKGTILYYQGQPGFAGQQASQLVDDVGSRFGLQALTNAQNSRSGWVTLTMGGTPYTAYCKAQFPVVVCSLAI